jgi:pimeloyl-ACP methyl ester carboxylesterase
MVARIEVDGVEIAYELRGKPGAQTVVLTPGGRFAMDSGGLPELADALVAGGKQVLLWDRPNCGASDVCFTGENESVMHARALLGLVKALKLGPVAVCGGSAGSRVSLIAASLDPKAVTHLVVWWISGGPIGLMQLAGHYCGEIATLASFGDMKFVADAPNFAQQIQRNPRNRDLILAQKPKEFVATMQRWALAYAPSPTSPIPIIAPEDFKRLTMPVLIMRNGESDVSHTRETSDWVHKLIPNSKMIDPPWPDHEWNESMQRQAKGGALFAGWPKMAPTILEFTKS